MTRLSVISCSFTCVFVEECIHISQNLILIMFLCLLPDYYFLEDRGAHYSSKKNLNFRIVACIIGVDPCLLNE